MLKLFSLLLGLFITLNLQASAVYAQETCTPIWVADAGRCFATIRVPGKCAVDSQQPINANSQAECESAPNQGSSTHQPSATSSEVDYNAVATGVGAVGGCLTGGLIGLIGGPVGAIVGCVVGGGALGGGTYVVTQQNPRAVQDVVKEVTQTVLPTEPKPNEPEFLSALRISQLIFENCGESNEACSNSVRQCLIGEQGDIYESTVKACVEIYSRIAVRELGRPPAVLVVPSATPAVVVPSATPAVVPSATVPSSQRTVMSTATEEGAGCDGQDSVWGIWNKSTGELIEEKQRYPNDPQCGYKDSTDAQVGENKDQQSAPPPKPTVESVILKAGGSDVNVPIVNGVAKYNINLVDLCKKLDPTGSSDKCNEASLAKLLTQTPMLIEAHLKYTNGEVKKVALSIKPSARIIACSECGGKNQPCCLGSNQCSKDGDSTPGDKCQTGLTCGTDKATGKIATCRDPQEVGSSGRCKTYPGNDGQGLKDGETVCNSSDGKRYECKCDSQDCVAVETGYCDYSKAPEGRGAEGVCDTTEAIKHPQRCVNGRYVECRCDSSGCGWTNDNGPCGSNPTQKAASCKACGADNSCPSNERCVGPDNPTTDQSSPFYGRGRCIKETEKNAGRNGSDVCGSYWSLTPRS